MFHYLAYNLNIQSVLPLPELFTADPSCVSPREKDKLVTIRLGTIEDTPPESVGRERYTSVTVDTAFVVRKDVGAFSIRNGRQIIIHPTPDVDERVLRLYLLNSALPMLLHQRGFLVLHASAIAINGVAVVFLGSSGRGKSTMAAALHARGHQVVADDVAAIQTEFAPMVFPGVPQLRLWSDSLISLGDAPETFPLLHPQFDKRGRSVRHNFSLQPLPLKNIYVLAESEIEEIEQVSPQETLVELVRHTYAARLTATVDAATHFRHCARLAQQIPIRRLKRPSVFARLGDVALMVEDDLAS